MTGLVPLKLLVESSNFYLRPLFLFLFLLIPFLDFWLLVSRLALDGEEREGSNSIAKEDEWSRYIWIYWNKVLIWETSREFIIFGVDHHQNNSQKFNPRIFKVAIKWAPIFPKKWKSTRVPFWRVLLVGILRKIDHNHVMHMFLPYGKFQYSVNLFKWLLRKGVITVKPSP